MWRTSSYTAQGADCVEVARISPQLPWRKSSRSRPAGTDCVEVANLVEGCAVRDSKNTIGPVLTFTRAEWATLLTTIKTGHHDLP